MLFSKVLVALSGVALAAAYAVPSGAADGSYVVFKIDGKEVHLTMEDFLKKHPQATKGKATESFPALAGTSPTLEGNSLMKRRSMYCGCGYNMVDFETDRAVQGLKDQFNLAQSIYTRGAFYTISGPVVAFFCNLTDYRQSIAPWRIGQGFAEITSACGLYIAGSLEGLYGETVLGYMRYYGNGQDFCQESRGSPLESC